MIYLDSSALLKLIRAEAESQALAAFIDERAGTRWCTSELARAELPRAIRRLHSDDRAGSGSLESALDHADRLWDSIDLVPVSTRLLRAAADIEHPLLRTLDAIHLATASGVRTGVSAFVTYDKRLADAAGQVGLPVTVPA